jgi:hypothetical protein
MNAHVQYQCFQPTSYPFFQLSQFNPSTLLNQQVNQSPTVYHQGYHSTPVFASQNYWQGPFLNSNMPPAEVMLLATILLTTRPATPPFPPPPTHSDCNDYQTLHKYINTHTSWHRTRRRQLSLRHKRSKPTTISPSPSRLVPPFPPPPTHCDCDDYYTFYLRPWRRLRLKPLRKLLPSSR